VVEQISTAELAAELRMAMMRLVRRIKRETGGAGTPSAISALAAVARLGSPTVGELAEAEGITRPSASAQADVLEERGLLRRERSDVDGRLVRLRLTSAGSRALERSRSQRNAWFARRLRRLSEPELQTLAAAARILERLLEEERP
jgi:DNA-binding MarR family transcriptional regulator